MDIAFVSQFQDGLSVVRACAAPGLAHIVRVGDRRPLNEAYCRHVLAGRLPQIIPDTARDPVARTLPATRAMPIGSYLGMPLRLPNGRCYGMLCCIGFAPKPSLNARDHKLLQAFCEVAAFEIDRHHRMENKTRKRRLRIEAVLEDGGPQMTTQPICAIGGAVETVGMEALAKFGTAPRRPASAWFAEAGEVGLGLALELAAIQKALRLAQDLPPPLFLSFNASPDTVMSEAFAKMMTGPMTRRLVVEITERTTIANYATMQDRLAPLRQAGLRLAVDDAGAGYSSLQHIFRLRPDFIKFDMSLTRGIDTDLVRQALVGALVGFSHETDSTIVAEGVETAAELAALRTLGVPLAQGHHLAMPSVPACPPARLRERCAMAPTAALA